MTDAPPPDALRNLVVFLIALAILGTIIALAFSFVIGLPAQQGVLPIAINCYFDPGNPYTCNGGFARNSVASEETVNMTEFRSLRITWARGAGSTLNIPSLQFLNNRFSTIR